MQSYSLLKQVLHIVNHWALKGYCGLYAAWDRERNFIKKNRLNYFS
jgi:hypothetical protein